MATKSEVLALAADHNITVDITVMYKQGEIDGCEVALVLPKGELTQYDTTGFTLSFDAETSAPVMWTEVMKDLVELISDRKAS